MTRARGSPSHARLSASQIESTTSKIRHFPGREALRVPMVDANQPEVDVEMSDGMRRETGIRPMGIMPSAMGSGMRRGSRQLLSANGPARIIGTRLKNLRWAEAAVATSALRRGRQVRVMLSGVGAALRHLQGTRTNGGVAPQLPPRRGQTRMAGANLQPRVAGGRINGGRADPPRGKSKTDGASHRLRAHSKVAGASLRRMNGVRRPHHAHENKMAGASRVKMTGGNQPLHNRATRGSGASPRSLLVRRSPAQVVQ